MDELCKDWSPPEKPRQAFQRVGKSSRGRLASLASHSHFSQSRSNNSNIQRFETRFENTSACSLHASLLRRFYLSGNNNSATRSKFESLYESRLKFHLRSLRTLSYPSQPPPGQDVSAAGYQHLCRPTIELIPRAFPCILWPMVTLVMPSCFISRLLQCQYRLA